MSVLSNNSILSFFYYYLELIKQWSLVSCGCRNCLPLRSSLPIFREVQVIRSLVFCVVFCRWLFLSTTIVFTVF